jgi:hypothetical protein
MIPNKKSTNTQMNPNITQALEIIKDCPDLPKFSIVDHIADDTIVISGNIAVIDRQAPYMYILCEEELSIYFIDNIKILKFELSISCGHDNQFYDIILSHLPNVTKIYSDMGLWMIYNTHKKILYLDICDVVEYWSFKQFPSVRMISIAKDTKIIMDHNEGYYPVKHRYYGKIYKDLIGHIIKNDKISDNDK